MTEETLKTYLQQLFEFSPTPEITIAWQGGEPMLMGQDFFARAVEYADELRQPHQKIIHSIQTNGTLINTSWAKFFADNNFLVGLSIDGPKELHDNYRHTQAGKGSFDKVRRSWNLLKKHDVNVNILCSVNAINAEHPIRIYKFFRNGLSAKFIQLIPIVERDANGEVTDFSVEPEQYGDFLTAIFDEWVQNDVGEVYVQLFDIALGNWIDEYHLCVFSPTCGNALVLEHNGDVYACDHFVDQEHKLGNITETPLGELVQAKKQLEFGQSKQRNLSSQCSQCEVRFACHGGCIRNQFRTDNLNYFCPSYKSFFQHIDKPMKKMAALLKQGRAPSDIMKANKK